MRVTLSAPAEVVSEAAAVPAARLHRRIRLAGDRITVLVSLNESVPSLWEFPLPDGLVLVRADSFDLYALNSSASYAWTLFKSKASRSAAAAKYSRHYEIPLAIAEQDIEKTWSDWQETLLAPAITDTVSEPTPIEIGHPTFTGTYCFCGKTVRVVLHRRDLVDEIAPRLAPLMGGSLSRTEALFEVTASNSGYHIYVNGQWVESEVNLSEARIRLLQELVRYAIPGPKWLATFHAAACGDDTRCILFPAASHSGKTTLAAALMHSGLLLYAEDSAVLQGGTLAVPMTPFSLMVREGSWPLVIPRFPELAKAPVISHSGTDVRFLAPRWDGQARSASVLAIVFSRYEPGSVTALEPLDTFETLLRLQESGFWVEHDRQSITDFIHWLGSRPTYSLTYSNLDEAVDITRKMLAD